MQTDTYANLFTLVQSLCGATLSTQETTRIKAFINARARSAHLRSDYWPRQLVVGQRLPVTSADVVTTSQTGADDVDAFLKIHKTQPWDDKSAQEYEFYVSDDGAKLISYSTDSGALEITGTLVPDVTGFVTQAGTSGGKNYYTTGAVEIVTTTGTTITWSTLTETWNITSKTDGGLSAKTWSSTDDVATPDLVTTWTANGGATGTPTVTSRGSIFATYRKQLSDTYGDGSGEQTTIPGEWFDFMGWGSYADWLRSEGQTEKAFAEEGFANSRLEQELEKIDRMHIGDSVGKRIRTHLNMQQRSPG